MREKIAEILKKEGIEIFGFCSFYELENELFECSARSRLPKNSKTIITCLFPYKVTNKKPKNISRYAAVPDYHSVCLKTLKKAAEKLNKIYPQNKFECFVDNSPINEVKAAFISGLGKLGKNNLIINEKYGSYCFICEIITDLEIENEKQKNKECINCGACINACPTGFLKDKNIKCLSAITQQKKELTKEEEKIVIKCGSVWGCDICQEVCPLNKEKDLTKVKKFKEEYRQEYKKGEDISGRAYEWRGERVILRNLKLLKENKKKDG